MNPDTSQQPGFDLTTLDVLLNSFSQSASNPSTSRSSFYSEITHKLSAATESIGACVVVKNQQDQFRLVGHCGIDKLSDAQRSDTIASIRNLVAQSIESNTHGVANSGKFKIPYARCRSAAQLDFVFCFLRPSSDDSLTDQVHVDLSREVARQIEIYENQQSAARTARSVAEVTQISKLAQDLGKASSDRELSFHLVNDMAKLTRADRVSLVAQSGRIRSISGVTDVSHQTELARNIGALARLASSINSLEWHGDSVEVDAPRPPRGLAQVIQKIEATSGYVVPLRSGQQSRGILIFEYFQSDKESSFDRRQLINEVVEFALPIVDRNHRNNTIPFFAAQEWLFNTIMVRSIRSGLLVLCSFALVTIACYWLFIMTSPFEIYGEGTLDTADKNIVISHVEGDVESLLVDEKSYVEKDQPLVKIRSRDLEKEQTKVIGLIEEASTELQTLEVADFGSQQETLQDQARRASDIKRLKVRLQTLNAEREFYSQKEKRLTIGSPIEGMITTTNLRQKLIDRPINRGDPLMTVSKTKGEWELKIKIPDARIEFIKRAMVEAADAKLDVRFRLTVDSSQTYTGKLERLDFRANQDPEDESPTVTAFVSIDESELGESLRIGARVYGKVDCGVRTNFYLLTYEAQNRIRQWLF